MSLDSRSLCSTLKDSMNRKLRHRVRERDLRRRRTSRRAGARSGLYLLHSPATLEDPRPSFALNDDEQRCGGGLKRWPASVASALRRGCARALAVPDVLDGRIRGAGGDHVLNWAADRIEEYVRFERFGKDEEQRRRRIRPVRAQAGARSRQAPRRDVCRCAKPASSWTSCARSEPRLGRVRARVGKGVTPHGLGLAPQPRPRTSTPGDELPARPEGERA